MKSLTAILAKMEQAVDHFVTYMNLTEEEENEVDSMLECFDVALKKLYRNEEVKRAVHTYEPPRDLQDSANTALCKYGNAYYRFEVNRTEDSTEIVEYENRVRALVEFMMFDEDDYGCNDESDEEMAVEMAVKIAADFDLPEFVDMAVEKLQKLELKF